MPGVTGGGRHGAPARLPRAAGAGLASRCRNRYLFRRKAERRISRIQMQLTVNHVLSSKLDSPIFQALYARLKRLAPPDIVLTRSVRPEPRAHIHHFHRPHLEKHLPPGAVATVHHDLGDVDPWVAFDKFLPRYAEAAHVICLNRIQAERLHAHGIGRVSIIPHGYDGRILPRPAAAKSWRPGERIRIGFVSRQYPRRVKGEAHLVELLKRIDPARFELVLVGNGRALDGGIAQRLGFHAEVYEELPYRLFGRLYAGLHVLLVASLFEGGPACLPEALRTATPIISTPVGMAGDCIEEGVNGFFLTGNADLDAERLRGLAYPDSPTGLPKLLAGAFALCDKAITWEANADRHFALYRELARSA